jgi:hypothetical protein
MQEMFIEGNMFYVSGGESGAYLNPEFRRPAESKATDLTLQNGDSLTATVKISPLPK